MEQKQGISAFLVILIIVLVALIAGGGVWWWMSKKSTATTTTSTTAITAKTTTTTSTAETAGWKTYTSSQYKLSFKYPSDWIVDEQTEEQIPSSFFVNLSSPATKAENDKLKETEGLPPEFEVMYYASIADDTENTSNNLGATTIPELIDKSENISQIATTTLGGQTAYEVYWEGMGRHYVILAMWQNHLYELWFGGIENKANLTSNQKTILSSFKFL
jgi:hypothetical protein